MKQLLLLLLLLCFSGKAKAQLYFPPVTGSVWETTDPSTLGWCQDSINELYDFLEINDTKAFIVLKDGRIVLERYFGTFTVDSFWVWNSAGKTLTAMAVGIAQEEGYLSIDDTTSQYLGAGWTNMTTTQEEKITVRHQLTMTTGMIDTGSYFLCTDPACLNYLADPGDRWAYHNAPYTLLDGVIENATGMTLNQWVTQKICLPTGMFGFYAQIDYNNIFISKARTMARYGLLLQNQGIWNGTPVLNDPDYFQEMTHSSQSLNPSYGYLTWLNGQSSYMIPGLQFSFPGSPLPNAPADVYSAMGKNGQIINVSPSTGLVVVRMGDMTDNDLIPVILNDSIWYRINRLSCNLSMIENTLESVTISPNPVSSEIITLNGWQKSDHVSVRNTCGQLIDVQISEGILDSRSLPAGIYLITINRSALQKTFRLVVN